MINKIKKEIEKNFDERTCGIEGSEAWIVFKDNRKSMEKCLKWAEELEKEISEEMKFMITAGKGRYYETQIKPKIEKAFHGQEGKEDE